MQAAVAFDNALPEAADFRMKNAGEMPGDLGLTKRRLQDGPNPDYSDGPVLKECDYGPNCFSTTYDPDDPSLGSIMPLWKPPKDADAKKAIGDLNEIIKAYPPGQQKVDGGVFKIIKVTDTYLFAQFESMKKGRIDDTEFAMTKPGEVQVRSSGRIGRKADYGSNAKRLNYISEKLRAKGWNAPAITSDTNIYYYKANAGKTKIHCTGVDCPFNVELIDEEPKEKNS